MSLLLFLFTLGPLTAGQRIAVEPFVPISVWYPPSADVDGLKRDFVIIRRAGFNAVTTWVTWRDGEPRRGAYNLLNLDRMIAVANEAALKVQVEVYTEPEPSWKTGGTNALAAEFYEYVRRRVGMNPAVFTVVRSGTAPPDETRRAAVGRGAGSLTPRQGRKALWSAIARGSRGFGFVDPDGPVSPDVLALGETVGVITRNAALFAPLEPRRLREGDVTVSERGRISVHVLESADAFVIIGINHATDVRKVTITFPPEIPEAIWQNMEEGVAVQFVMGSKGPSLEHTFAPEDVLVLAIRKKLR